MVGKMVKILNKREIEKKNYFQSKIFLRLFLSYVAFIAIATILFSLLSVYVSSVTMKEQATQLYTLKLQEVKNMMDSQFEDAKNIASRIKTSQIIRSMYISLTDVDKTADTYTLYQSINEMNGARSVSGNISIYDILLFLNDDRRVYSGSGVVLLPEKFDGSLFQADTLAYGTLQQQYDIQGVSDLRFYKEYLLYSENYSYDSTKKRGVILVLFDINSLQNKIDSFSEDGVHYVVYSNEESILGNPDFEGIKTEISSSVLPNLSYTAIVDEDLYSLRNDSMLIWILAVTVFITLAFIFLSFFLSRAYYNPIRKLRKLVSGSHNLAGGDEIGEIMQGINGLMGEMDDYKSKIENDMPFVQQAIVHAALFENLSRQEIEYLLSSNDIDYLEKYFMVFVVNLGLKEECVFDEKEFKRAKNSLAYSISECSLGNIMMLYYEKDKNNSIIVTISSSADEATNAVYCIYEAINNKIKELPYLVTIGADEPKNDVAALPSLCANATKALGNMLLGGRGSIFFYDEETQGSNSSYYFPQNYQIRLFKAIKAKDNKAVDELLDEIYDKNLKEYDWTPVTLQLLLYELYVMSVRCIGKLNLTDPIKVDAEKVQSFSTLEEVFIYYRGIYEEACIRIGANEDRKSIDEEIIKYVQDNCCNPKISLKWVSEHFNTSDKYVSTVFAKKMNVNFSDYIHNRRMERAMELIKDSSIFIKQIASLCGYTNKLTFRRHFEVYSGMIPSEYRKNFI